MGLVLLFYHQNGGFWIFISGCRLGKLGDSSFSRDLQSTLGFLTKKSKFHINQGHSQTFLCPSSCRSLTCTLGDFTWGTWMPGGLLSSTWPSCSPCADQTQFVACEQATDSDAQRAGGFSLLLSGLTALLGEAPPLRLGDAHCEGCSLRSSGVEGRHGELIQRDLRGHNLLVDKFTS